MRFILKTKKNVDEEEMTKESRSPRSLPAPVTLQTMRMVWFGLVNNVQKIKLEKLLEITINFEILFKFFTKTNQTRCMIIPKIQYFLKFPLLKFI